MGEVKIRMFINDAIPMDYQHALQTVFYKFIGRDVHDNDKIKLITFSNLLGVYEVKNKNYIYFEEAKIIFRSYYDNIVDKVARGFAKEPVEIFGKRFTVAEIEIEKNVLSEEREEVWVRTISPVCVNIYPGNVFPKPDEKLFLDTIIKNLKKKSLIAGIDMGNVKMEILPGYKKRVAKYKKGVFDCYDAVFHIKANPEVIKLILTSGIGSKNSCGFGCVECVEG